MSKGIVKPLLTLLTCMLILSLAACAGDDIPVEQSTPQAPDTAQPIAQPAESVCNITEERVGQDVRVTGEIGFIEMNNPDGVFANLEEGSCRIGIFVKQNKWKSWTSEEQALFATGTKVVVEGHLRSFEGTLLVDLSSPPQPAEPQPADLSSPPQPADDTVTEPLQESAAAISTPPLAELNLIEAPLSEKRLDVEMVYSGTDEPALCYLGSYTMLAKYADSSLDLAEVIAYSGFGPSAYYIAPANMLMDGWFLWSIGQAAGNLGFDYYVGALEGGSVTVDYISAKLPENAKQVLQTENEEQAFDLLKRLISSDIPVEVYLDCSFAKETLIAHTSYWNKIFTFQDTYANSAHASHYFVATGYDQDFVYVNDPTEPQAGMGKDIPIDISSFLAAWQNGNHPTFAEEARVGPYWMFFLGQRGTAKSLEEIIAWNRDIAVKAPDEIRKAAPNPNIDYVIHGGNMCRARLEFGNFLKRNGYPEAGDMFIEAGEIFEGIDRSADPGADLLKIADLQEQSLEKW